MFHFVHGRIVMNDGRISIQGTPILDNAFRVEGSGPLLLFSVQNGWLFGMRRCRRRVFQLRGQMHGMDRIAHDPSSRMMDGLAEFQIKNVRQMCLQMNATTSLQGHLSDVIDGRYGDGIF
jgi:hypothetical protein